jgi:Protein of unknown function (DUF3313)
MTMSPTTSIYRRATHTAVAAFAAGLLAACATPNVAASGFLGTYDGLEASEEPGAVKVSSASPATYAKYTSVLIDDVTMIEARLKPEQAAAVKDAVAEALQTSLSRDRKITTDQSPTTLRVRVAVTEVNTSNVALNAVMTPLLFTPVDFGSLAIEVDVSDASTGERIAAMTWARGAKANNVLGAYASTGNARALAPVFADRVATLVSPTGAAD